MEISFVCHLFVILVKKETKLRTLLTILYWKVQISCRR
jgi:hypothetical protein